MDKHGIINPFNLPLIDPGSDFHTPMALPTPSGLAEEEWIGGGSGGSFKARVTEWNAGTSDYTWNSVEINSAYTGWSDISAGLSSTGSSTGTQDQAKAKQESFLEDLVDATAGTELIVDMFAMRDADGDTQFMFSIPLQLDSTFTHRTAATGTPTLGDRRDLTLTTTEIQDEDVDIPSAALWDAMSLEGQGTNGTLGFVKTEVWKPTAYEVDPGDEKLYGYVQDHEYDVLRRWVSSSDVWRIEIDAAVDC